MKAYSKALSITSQVTFCSVPLRLDAYSKCSFGCAFCFAKSRGGNGASGNLKIASASALARRLELVEIEKGNGRFSGALNEFLSRRIPIQLGGMTDPFSVFEQKFGVTLNLLNILNQHDYPTLISTKGIILAQGKYLDLLESGNYFVRISITGAEPRAAKQLESGVSPLKDRLKLIELLTERGIPVSVRLQPIIPGHEKYLPVLTEQIGEAGAKHISAEFLKWPIEKNSSQAKFLRSHGSIASVFFAENQPFRSGREWLLPVEYRVSALEALKKNVEEKGMVFGFAETDMLHLNRFSSCCNAADLFLRDANFHSFTFPNLLKAQNGAEIRFPEKPRHWIPTGSVGTYLNSRSRAPSAQGTPDLISIMRKKWNEGSWRGGPSSFVGVQDTGRVDGNGNKVFLYQS